MFMGDRALDIVGLGLAVDNKHWYSVTRCTHEVRFIRQKKKCDVPLKFF